MDAKPIRLGLGCSRFGSLVRGVDRDAAATLVAAAIDMGVLDFDTANIYGQGDSERFLGAALAGRPDARITTKAGQRFPARMRAMIPLKKLLRPLIAGRAQAAVAGARATPLPRDWSAAHLRAAIEASLRRLRRDSVDLFLLHSPDAETLRRGDAIETLVRLRDEGKARAIGVSVDDGQALEAALADPRVEAVQLPLSPASPADPGLLSAARARGVTLIAREILAGAASPAAIDDALAYAAGQPVDIALLGTRSAAHLAHARAAIGGSTT